MDPWTTIRGSIERRCTAAESRRAAVAFVEQAQDFFRAAGTAGIIAARPLLLYYCFMNLAKAFILTVGQQETLGKVQHGLSERLRTGGRELDDAFLLAFSSPNARSGDLNLFDEFLRALGCPGLPSDQEFDIQTLLPQVVPGHRLWAEARDVSERFIALHTVRFMEDRTAKQLWLLIEVFHDDLTRLAVSRSRFLKESALGKSFREVQTKSVVGGRKVIRFEQKEVRQYSDRPSDAVPLLVQDLKPFLWTTVSSIPPYRRYYVYLAPLGERAQVLPQLASIYALTYYLGSITRYRPHHFDAIMKSDLGPRVEEFISGQPLQLLYLMASEFAEQDITKPSIV